MSNIRKIIARVVVDDIDKALPLYMDLAGIQEPWRFGFRGLELASVGPFLLLSGPQAADYSNRVATIEVADLSRVIASLERALGTIIDGPVQSPGGTRLIAQHPDGSIWEYIQPTDSGAG
ncbi:VOC family protein [Granulicella sp. S190]|uniref:VOC family protein n=1 Tax=Granulicella sp. S190 TaxID=1747226 RepID=UPI00131D8961|nr:hypothetical protein [Granulicella sp. S190]